jgi:hypothetical protein
MKPLTRFLLAILLFNIIIAVVTYALGRFSDLNIHTAEILFLSVGFSLIAFITFFIFLKGQVKDPQDQTIHTLVAVVLKFILDISIAIIWFIVAKKTSWSYIIIFFVLYLALTLFSVINIVKTLKSKLL